jgi:aspartate-semialdehyde dehydrogenase
MKKIALFGSTGNVGRRVAEQLLSKGIASSDTLLLFASPSSAGKRHPTTHGELQNPETCPFEDLAICIFSTESDVSKTYIPKALEKGCLVVDSSSAFRMKEDVPLVVAPVNGHLIRPKTHRLYSCANCIASPISLVTAPLKERFGLKRVQATTYQSTSGAGKDPMDELRYETESLLKERPYLRSHFQRQIAFNVIPQIDKIRDDGYTNEEHKIIHELQKILDLNFPVTATSVRVPVMIGHSVSLSLQLKTPFQMEEVLQLLSFAPHVKISKEHYTTPAEVMGQDSVHVGRIRRDQTLENGLHLWLCSDNLRRGAATDAVEVCENLLKQL